MDKLKQVFEFFNVNEKEIKEFLVKDLGIFNKIDKLEYEDYKKIADYFKINVSWFYDNSEELLIEKYGFYKRYESFCKEILEKNPTRIYIISEYKPDKSIDESNDSNYFYLIAEYEKRIFNGKEIKTFEIFDTSGCRWGYWRCRWEFKKLLLCLKKNYFSFTKLIGKINENIKEEIYKFKKGKIKFDDLIKNFSIDWYPGDYIEFKYENVNAKEEDELRDILKEMEDIKISLSNFELLYKVKSYLIDIYGYDEKHFKFSFEDSNRLVILKENKPFVVFELKSIEKLKGLFKVSILEKFEYYVLVASYGNDWFMKCFDREGNLIENIPFFKTLDEEYVINKLYDLFYKGGKEDLVTVRESLFYVLSNYEYLKNKFKNGLLKIKNKNFEIDELEIYITLRLLSFIDVQNNKKLIKILFDTFSDYKRGVLKFKEEFLFFLNSLVKDKEYYIVGFNPDVVKLDFKGCIIKDSNEYVNLVKNLLKNCNKNENISHLFYIDSSGVFLDNIDFTNFKSGILIVGYSFFNAIKKHSKFKEIVRKIKMIINFYEPLFENTVANFNLIFLGDESEDICIANLNFEKLFRYEDVIIKFLTQNQKIKENNDIFYITNEKFETEKIEFIKILNVLKQIENKSHKKLKDLGDIIDGISCKEKGNIQKLITIKNIKYNKIFSLDFISKRCYERNRNRLTQKDDFVIARVGNYKFAEINKEYSNCVIDDNLFILRPKDKESYQILKNFLYSKVGTYIFNNIKSGFKTDRIFVKDLENILVPININEFDNVELHTEKKEEYFTPCEKEINFIGIKDMALNFPVITGFLTKKEIEKIELKRADFQRKLYPEHLKNLEDFLRAQKAKYKFLPFLVFGIENFNQIDSEEFYIEDLNLCRLCMDIQDFKYNVKIIDGNHRWEAIKNYINLVENVQIGIVFIILEENAFSPVFYTLNSKSKPLISSDFINLMEQKDEILEELKELGINSPFIYFEIRNYFRKKNIFNYFEKKINLDEKILELVDYIEKNKLEKKIKFFKLAFSVVNKKIYPYLNESNKVLISFEIIKVILKYYRPFSFKMFAVFIQKEFMDFYQYLKETKLLEKLEELDLYPIFETYKKTYIPKSRKIYLSMPYHIHEDVIYYVIKDIINEISQKIGEKIELIRTDKRKLGVHKQIENKVYEEIEESDLMIADITGNNANVFAEVGYKMAIDTSKGLKEPQIIFVKNTKGYYERVIYEERRGNRVDEFQVNEHIRKNKVTKVAFNFAHIDQIEFEDVEYLKRELENMLLKYYNYYQIKKV